MSEELDTRESINVGGVIIHKSDNGLYSLRDLWRANGSNEHKKPAQFTRLSSTKDIINELLVGVDSHPPQKVTHTDVIQIKAKGTNRGTYANEDVCYLYAMWLSPVFQLQVIRAFKELTNAKSTDELIELKRQIDMFNANSESLAHREPSDKQSLSVILGIPSCKIQPYYDYLVGVGEISKKLVPQLPRAIYSATDDSKHVLDRKGKTILFDSSVINLFLKQHEVFEA